MVKGAYLLVMKLKANTRIKIGAKGLIAFKKGYYIYVGSAMQNLDKRLARHHSKKKTIRWHVDYFLRKAEIVDTISLESNKRIECQLSARVGNLCDDRVKGFGCSDCKCHSHLYYFKKKPFDCK
jgi:sugar fermentation stimulation protein A